MRGRTTGGRMVTLPKEKPIAPVGRRREPIVFLRSSRTPDATTGYNQTFTKYGKAWAEVRFSRRQVQAGENANDKYTHVFSILYPGYEIARSTYLLHGKKVFLVVSSEMEGERNEYLSIRCQEHANTTGHPFTIVDEDETSPVTVNSTAPPTADTTRGQNDFWNT